MLQAPGVGISGPPTAALSDYFDFSVFVDAPTDVIRAWYVGRFLRLRETAFSDPASYFHRYASLSDEEAVDDGRHDLGAHQRAQPRRERPAHP